MVTSSSNMQNPHHFPFLPSNAVLCRYPHATIRVLKAEGSKHEMED